MNELLKSTNPLSSLSKDQILILAKNGNRVVNGSFTVTLDNTAGADAKTYFVGGGLLPILKTTLATPTSTSLAGGSSQFGSIMSTHRTLVTKIRYSVDELSQFSDKVTYIKGDVMGDFSETNLGAEISTSKSLNQQDVLAIDLNFDFELSFDRGFAWTVSKGNTVTLNFTCAMLRD